jgi:hypothetical protein
MLQAHRRLARAGAGSAAPAVAPRPAAAAVAAIARRAVVRGRVVVRASAAAGDGKGSGDKDKASAAPAAPAPATPPAAAGADKKAATAGGGDGLNYVAHPFGTGRLSSDDDEGALFLGFGSAFFWGVKESTDAELTTLPPHTLESTNKTDLDVLEIKEIRHMLKKR